MSEMSEANPWYRQFWPWFLIALMAVSVAASVATVVIAYGLGDLEIPEDPVGRVLPSSGSEPGAGSLDARKT